MDKRHLAGLAAALGLTQLSLQFLPAADTWWHLAGGRYMIEQGTFPRVDPFSFTSGDYPWTNHEWLVELLFAAIHKIGGLPLLYAMKSLLVALAFAVLPAILLHRQGKSAFWLILTPLIAWACRLGSFVDVRAYLITYLFLSATVFFMFEFRESGRRLWLGLCVVMQVIWVNCHGAFILGPAVMGVFFLFGPRRKELGAATAATILAAVLNPYGPIMLLFPFSLLHVDAFSVGLNEWAKPDLLGSHVSYTILVASLLALLVAFRKRIDWALLAATSAFLLLGLKAWRHEPLAGLMLCYLVPLLLPEPKKIPEKVILALAALIFGGMTVQKAAKGTDWLTGLSLFPVEAVKVLHDNPQLPERMWNPYEWGGYLQWRLGPERKVFWDGRAHTVYPEAIYRDGQAIQFGEPWYGVMESRGLKPPEKDRFELLKEYDINFVMTTKYQGDLAEVLRGTAGWLLCHEDEICVLYLRDTEENRALMPGLRVPENEFNLAAKARQLRGQPEELAALQKLIQLNPSHRINLVGALFARGLVEEASEELKNVAPEAPMAGFWKARILLSQGKKDEAIAVLEEELKRHSELGPSKALLLELTTIPQKPGQPLDVGS